MFSFKCLKCGSTNMGYQKWVESCSPAVIDSEGHVEYKMAIVDKDNELGAVDGFVCMDCKDTLCLRGSQVETEGELIFYLSLTPEERYDLGTAYLDNFDDQAEEGEIIFPEKLDDVMSRTTIKDYWQCGYSEEQYDTDAEVTYRVDKYINKYGMPMALAIYLHDNGYDEKPEVVKANLEYVNNAMKEKGYAYWVDITPEQIQVSIDDFKDD